MEHPGRRPVGVGARLLVLPADARAGAGPRGAGPAHRHGAPAAGAPRRSRRADDHVELTLRRVREPRTAARADGRDADRARPIRDRRRRRELVRARGVRHRFEDLGFAEHWLVVDLRPDDVDALSLPPGPVPVCDPARPYMHTRNGRSRRRFEFMLLPGERPEDFAGADRVWGLLAPGSRRPTASWCATRSTSSAGGWPRPCAPDGCCWPATLRTPCRRSWGRACAPASGTRRTSRGGWTSSCAASPTSDCSTATRPSGSPRTSGS